MSPPHSPVPAAEHPDLNTLAELVCRQLGEAAVAEVERHVADCTTCRQLVGTLAAASLPALGYGAEAAKAAVPRDPSGRYVVREELARGGMGRISIAEDTRLGRTVAIKDLRTPNAELTAGFERELALTARLQHPSIVTIHDAGTWASGEPFYVMRLVSGQPLDRLIARSTTPVARLGLLPHAIAMVEAVAYAHAQGVVHRDLKPANVVVGDFGETVVIDWGLATELRAADAGVVVGTPAYMAPEQARGEAVDARADVYALGAVLYQVVTGLPPYVGGTAVEVVAAVRERAPEPLLVRAPDVPPDLVTIIDKAMARDRDHRYATARELAADVVRFQRGQLVGAHRYSTWQLVGRWIARHRAAVAVATVALLVLVVLGTLGLRRIVGAEAEAKAGRHEAEDLIAFMLGDLGKRLEPLGRLDLLDGIAKKAIGYYDEYAGGATSADLATRVLARRGLARVLRDQGHLDQAIVQYRAALAKMPLLGGELISGEPSRVHAELGDALLATGDAKGALAEYRDALALAEEGFALAPGSAALALEIASCHSDIGALLARSNLRDALAEYEVAVAILQLLAQSHADEVYPMRELLIVHNRIGDALRDGGDAMGALAEYRAAADILSRLLATTPDDADLERERFVSHAKVGGILVLMGDSAGALAEFRAGTEIAQKLAADDPTNAARQQDLYVSHMNVASVLVVQGTDALAEYRAALRITETLANNDPVDLEKQHELSNAHAAVGESLLANGDAAGALADLRTAVAIAQTLVTKDPKNLIVQHDLVRHHFSVGQALQAQHDSAGALAESQATLAIARQLASADASSARWQFDVVAAHYAVGEALEARGDATRARAEFEQGLASARALESRGESDAQLKNMIAELVGHLQPAARKR